MLSRAHLGTFWKAVLNWPYKCHPSLGPKASLPRSTRLPRLLASRTPHPHLPVGTTWITGEATLPLEFGVPMLEHELGAGATWGGRKGEMPTLSDFEPHS